MVTSFGPSNAVNPAEPDTFGVLVVEDFEGTPSIIPTTLPVKSAANTVVGMSKTASSMNCVMCGTTVVASWLQIAMALPIDKELGRGSTHSIFQIFGAEIEPGEESVSKRAWLSAERLWHGPRLGHYSGAAKHSIDSPRKVTVGVTVASLTRSHSVTD